MEWVAVDLVACIVLVVQLSGILVGTYLESFS